MYIHMGVDLDLEIPQERPEKNIVEPIRCSWDKYYNKKPVICQMVSSHEEVLTYQCTMNVHTNAKQPSAP